ncbi:uncharacterized protein TNCV_925631 [Trichonephila clavipes]|nr:uncharacterized protein TNCV_925631 [Trichonephila clavipes]
MLGLVVRAGRENAVKTRRVEQAVEFKVWGLHSIGNGSIDFRQKFLDKINDSSYLEDPLFEEPFTDFGDRILKISSLGRLPGKRAGPAFTTVRHTGAQLGVRFRSATSFDSCTPLVFITGTLTAQRYVGDILRTVLIPFLLQYPGLIFQQDNARPHTACVAMNCLTACQTLPLSTRSLSNRSCPGYDGKATASTREC